MPPTTTTCILLDSSLQPRAAASFPSAAGLQQANQGVVELIRRLVLHPMPGPWDYGETGAGLQRLEQTADLLEHSLGGDVTLAPESVQPRPHSWDRGWQGGNLRQ